MATSRISITKEKAKKLVHFWEGHKTNHTRLEDCFDEETDCPIHEFFMELKKKVTPKEKKE